MDQNGPFLSGMWQRRERLIQLLCSRRAFNYRRCYRVLEGHPSPCSAMPPQPIPDVPLFEKTERGRRRIKGSLFPSSSSRQTLSLFPFSALSPSLSLSLSLSSVSLRDSSSIHRPPPLSFSPPPSLPRPQSARESGVERNRVRSGGARDHQRAKTRENTNTFALV